MEILALTTLKDLDNLKKELEEFWIENECPLFLIPIIREEKITVAFAQEIESKVSNLDIEAAVVLFDINDIDHTDIADWLGITKIPTVKVFDYGRLLPQFVYSDNDIIEFLKFVESTTNILENEGMPE